MFRGELVNHAFYLLTVEFRAKGKRKGGSLEHPAPFYEIGVKYGIKTLCKVGLYQFDTELLALEF